MIAMPVFLDELLHQELISEVEIEYGRFLYSLEGELDPVVLVAGIATLNAQLNGHICLDVARSFEKGLLASTALHDDCGIPQNVDEIIARLAESKLVGEAGDTKPLILEQGRLYLQKLWRYEYELAQWLNAKSRVIHSISDAEKAIIQSFLENKTLFDPINWQSVALTLSFMRDLLFISGGPGTGKTHAVLNIITALKTAKGGEDYRIAMAAPTGKASRRLSDSIQKGKNPITSQVDIPEEAVTVHKLLGSDYQGSTFKYGEHNKLPYDLIIVDEASMLDIHMWMRLVRAIAESAKLVILGDKDQLASVEAGSILGDVCMGENSFSVEAARCLLEVLGMEAPVNENLPVINDNMVFLTKSYRFDHTSGIKRLAKAINGSNAAGAIELLKSESYADLKLLSVSTQNIQSVIDEYVLHHYEQYSSHNDALGSSNGKKILCALRAGPFGVERINALGEKKIKKREGITAGQEWYPERIVMSKRNNPIVKIRNGEIGISKNDGEEYRIYFEGESKVPVSASRLSEYEPAYALTIHKSQGSEFDDIAIVLPNRINPLLSKELLYTAVTRARHSVLVIGDEEVIKSTIEASVYRNSGLKQRIWEQML
ncbi:MAG: exodeoxyribonuclease V subunit alpha [Balneolaceae bacterium]|nr:exodeoxyribonuclease V subunit alpha [Balneolaceae bacterium]